MKQFIPCSKKSIELDPIMREIKSKFAASMLKAAVTEAIYVLIGTKCLLMDLSLNKISSIDIMGKTTLSQTKLNKKFFPIKLLILCLQRIPRSPHFSSQILTLTYKKRNFSNYSFQFLLSVLKYPFLSIFVKLKLKFFQTFIFHENPFHLRAPNLFVFDRLLPRLTYIFSIFNHILNVIHLLLLSP
jgi:hypothetical protein